MEALLTWITTNTLPMLVVVFAFGVVIFVHEMGHFAIAKWVGITVHEFALGFGPRLAGFTRDGTEYNLRAFPFGGFVRMEGEDDPDSNADDPGSFLNKPVASQMAVVGGGVFMNYLTAFIVLVFVGFVWGPPDIEPKPTNVVGRVTIDSAGEKAGLRLNDRIVEVEGKTIATFEDLRNAVMPRAEQSTKLKIQRGNEELTMTVTPDVATEEGKKVGRLGVSPGGINFVFDQGATAGQVFSRASEWLVRITLLPFTIVKKLVAREERASTVAQNMGGPLAIGQMFFEIYHRGFAALLFFWAIISASVGGFNILPIPALDGARMLFLAIGAIRGRPLDPKKEGMVHAVGLMVLLAIMVLFSIQDVMRMIKGVRFFS